MRFLTPGKGGRVAMLAPAAASPAVASCKWPSPVILSPNVAVDSPQYLMKLRRYCHGVLLLDGLRPGPRALIAEEEVVPLSRRRCCCILAECRGCYLPHQIC